MDPVQCSLCGGDAERLAYVAGVETVQCKLCARYRIADSLKAILPAELRPYLSAYTRQTGEGIPSEDVEGSTPSLTIENFESLARSQSTVTPAEKMVKVLEVLRSRSKVPGQGALFSQEEDFPLISATSAAEVPYFIRHLRAAQLIEGPPRGTHFLLTPKGWERLTPQTPGGIPGTCFVAMSFGAELVSAYDVGIRPAIEDDCGFRVIRLDRVHHNENINDKIIADLRAAQFVVADFTEQKAGVYFEAGFAKGLGREVIWTCREAEFEQTHFDTRPYNHILWSSLVEFRETLTARVRATVPGARLK